MWSHVPVGAALKADLKKERELDARLCDPPPLPAFLSEHERRASRVDVDVRVDARLHTLFGVCGRVSEPCSLGQF